MFLKVEFRQSFALVLLFIMVFQITGYKDVKTRGFYNNMKKFLLYIHIYTFVLTLFNLI